MSPHTHTLTETLLTIPGQWHQDPGPVLWMDARHSQEQASPQTSTCRGEEVIPNCTVAAPLYTTLQVCDLLHLERLCVSHNVLTSLPHTFPHLTHLRELLLHQNKFSEFPSVICRLPSLELLWLGTNKIPRIPDTISTLSLLRCLHLDHNQLTELPESLCQLKQLQVLFLNHNSIWKLSENIGQLISLRHLLLHHNHIGELPLSICQLVAIERLDLRHNQLKHLPAGFRLFQTEKNGDGRSRVLTSNNPFDNTLKRMTSSEQGSPNPRPRTLSFPLSAHGRRRSDTLHSRSPSPVVISPRPVFTHSHSEDRP